MKTLNRTRVVAFIGSFWFILSAILFELASGYKGANAVACVNVAFGCWVVSVLLLMGGFMTSNERE